MIFKNKPSNFKSSAELEEEIRKHGAETKCLLAEVRKLRAEEAETDSATRTHKKRD